MRKDFLITTTLVAVLAVLFIARPFYGWWLRGFFEPELGPGASLDLRLKNEQLKAEIAKLEILKSQAPETGGSVSALIYSRYPFNFKNELLVDAGKSEGVILGRPVFFGDVLLGKVETVFDDTALIETVFDSRFQISVGVGNGGVKALLTGGSRPSLSLMPLTGSVTEGDVVYSVAPDAPYGAPIGEIEQVGVSGDRLFREASVKFSYDINEARALLIRK